MNLKPVLSNRVFGGCMLIGFTLIMTYISFNPINRVDAFFQTYVEQLNIYHLKQVMILITQLANPVVVIMLVLLIACVMWLKGHKLDAGWVILTLFVSDAAAYVIKHVVGRVRPVGQMIFDTGFSFPSIHTISAVIVVLIIISLVKHHKKSVWIVGLIWIVIVALSRIYLKNHFPTDTLGAIFLGFTIWSFMFYFHQTMSKKNFCKTFFNNILPK